MSSRFMATLRQLRRTDSELQAVLPAQDIRQAATDTTYQDRGTVYTVVTTVWAFLGQLLHADHSCQRAVHALNAQRAATGQDPVSDDTGGFCKARQRLPEKLCTTLLQRSGQQAESDAPAAWNWQGRRVRVVDGSTLKVADSPANRAAFPLRQGWVAGISYSVVRILVVFSLVTGSVVNGLLVPYQGKGNGETAMLRALADHFELDDVLLGDGYFSGYWDMVWWQQRGVAVVSRLSNNRHADFRRGRRLGRDDHVVVWQRTERPDWVSVEQAATYPRQLEVREVRVRVKRPGFRVQTLIVVTTLLDAQAFPASALAQLYRRRWQAELNLRSLKTQMAMDLLVTQTPEMIRKEYAMYLLAYNVVRRVMVAAAVVAGVQPWQVSFQGAWQSLTEYLTRLHGCVDVEIWLVGLLRAAAAQEVGNRPDRREPYAKKKWANKFPTLKQPRQKYKGRHCPRPR